VGKQRAGRIPEDGLSRRMGGLACSALAEAQLKSKPNQSGKLAVARCHHSVQLEETEKRTDYTDLRDLKSRALVSIPARDQEHHDEDWFGTEMLETLAWDEQA
jgi:hypothetical protein